MTKDGDMVPEGNPERESLRLALKPGERCPAIEKLECALDPEAAPPDLAHHIKSCGYCQAELELLRVFQTPARDRAETEAIRKVSSRLKSPSSSALPSSLRSSGPWWRRCFQARWLTPAALATAGVLIVLAIGLQWRMQRAPGLHVPDQEGGEFLRTGTLTVLAPIGDIPEAPAEIRWEPAATAAQYQIRLLEVDRTELWRASASQPHLELPPQVRAMAVPAKTLLVEVKAVDSLGAVVAESETVRFRVLHKLYKR